MAVPEVFILTPTVLNASPYTSNTVVGGLQTIAGVPARGVIRDILVVIDGTITPALDLYFFRGAPSAIADNAAFTPTYADQQKFFTGGKVSIASADYVTLNSKTHATKPAINRDYVALAAGANGWATYLYIVNTAGPTFPNAAALTVVLSFWGNL